MISSCTLLFSHGVSGWYGCWLRFIIVMATADSYYCIIIIITFVRLQTTGIYIYIHYATNFSITHPSFASFLWMTFLAGSGHRAPPASPTSDGITQHDRR